MTPRVSRADSGIPAVSQAMVWLVPTFQMVPKEGLVIFGSHTSDAKLASRFSERGLADAERATRRQVKMVESLYIMEDVKVC